ncbi:SEC14-like protein 2 [Orchesella cincta]|uniref:SEC14-like protein 2 n=1 Tax=Orchesella cincta TaxID=48709 RepID=A0A1D2N1I5_ORCCI|nr:SEC14-like protein 2 [Orchesella cincta]
MSGSGIKIVDLMSEEVIKVENEEERQILKQLQARTKDLHQDDATLLRFLRARDNNIVKAEEMLRKCLEWRKNHEISTILKWKMPTFLDEALPFEFRGVDNNGGPVAWLPLGRWRGRHLIEGGKKQDCLRAAYYMFELCLHHVRKNGNRPTFVIFGMEQLSFYQISHLETMQTFFYGFQQLEQNYPEILRKLYCINAFAFVKPVMSPRTLAKIEVYGSDKKKWLPLLLDSMPRDIIPPEYLE